MRLLLDTHVWLWTMMEPERLNAQARHSIEREAELMLSVASIWEMAIKQAVGKLRIDGGLEGFRRSVRQMNGTELAIRAEHALAAAALPEHHRDPFDRMLVA
jgi:PIN domain nuclease of toxin-antitoxin system